MKIFKVILGLLIVLVLISSQPGLAQEDDLNFWQGPELNFNTPEAPPDASGPAVEMPEGGDFNMVRDAEGKIEFIPIPGALERSAEPAPDAVPLLPDALDPSQSTPPAEKDQSLPAEEIEDPSRIVDPASGLLLISTVPAVIEYNPSVAQGGDYYMVAFAKGGDILASVYYNAGNHLTTYLIDNWITDFNVPRIAYHAPTGLFLIAYHTFNGSNYDIWYTTVSALTGLKGTHWAISTSADEKFPDVACKQDANTCLIAYEHGSGSSIRGKYVTLSSSGVSSASATYSLSNTNGYMPFIAWGKNTGRYLLTYTYLLGGLEQFPVFTHVLDVDPLGTPYTHSAIYAWDFSSWPSHQKWATGTAYDPCTEKFILLFDFDYSGNNTDTDVYYSTINKTAGVFHRNYLLTNTFDDERGGGVRFITGDHLPAACGVMDKLGVTYTDWTHKRIYATDLRGNSDVVDSRYRDDSKSRHLIVATLPSSASPFWRSSISSGSSQADMFVVFNEFYVSPLNVDIYGRLIRMPAKTFLPIILK